ncbi:unnamed protein product [Protopolystoma xenopodis]|uniref:Uncharacterized protein n=1 Tax=Protopolystoma xenopodis TaxID=117903 RepID=A0A3S5B0J5_9PLAT|nr:unnamed protein product [Protopolystoma xenopodis]
MVHISSYKPSSVKFNRIRMGIVDLLSPPKENRDLLTIISHFTRWPEAIPIPDIQAVIDARTFVTHWVSRFGTLTTIATYRGRQFE